MHFDQSADSASSLLKGSLVFTVEGMMVRNENFSPNHKTF